jgi:iron complex outermembrane receptor protein
VSLEIHWKNGAFKLSSITARRHQQATDDYDSDFTSADLLSQNLNHTHLDTFTQELRLAFDDGGAVTGLLGGYYFNKQVRYDDTLSWGSAARPYFDALSGGGITALENALIGAGLPIPPGTFFGAGQGQVINTRQDNDSYTLFGQLDWKLVERLTLTAGRAYTQNKKNVTIAQSDTDVFGSLDGSDPLHPSLVNIGFGGAFAALTAPPPFGPGLPPGVAAPIADHISVTPCSPANPPPQCNRLLALYPLQILSR